MKHLFAIAFLFCLSMTANAQWWFDLGIKGAYGGTGWLDKNVFDHGDYKHKLSDGTAFGVRLGFNSGYHVGLSVEYDLARSTQDFNFEGSLYNAFTWKHNDLAAYFRYSGNGAYVELGGKLSNVNKVELIKLNNPVIDVSDNFEDSYVSGIFGFGSYLAGSELLTLNMGVRVHYAFTDIVNDVGKENNYPLVDFTPDDRSKKTIPAAVQLQMELNYAFGRFAKAACQDRWRLILFR